MTQMQWKVLDWDVIRIILIVALLHDIPKKKKKKSLSDCKFQLILFISAANDLNFDTNHIKASSIKDLGAENASVKNVLGNYLYKDSNLFFPAL